MSESNPFLAYSRLNNIPYGTVLSATDALVKMRDVNKPFLSCWELKAVEDISTSQIIEIGALMRKHRPDLF